MIIRRLKMHLSDFKIPDLILPKNADEIPIKSITTDSRDSSQDCMFIAIKGNNKDGHDYIDEAISGGASNVLVDYKYKKLKKFPVTKAKNVRKALALISSIYYNEQPNTVAAVTGTNGKTSVCSFLNQIWKINKFKSASLGTLGLKSNPALNSSKSDFLLAANFFTSFLRFTSLAIIDFLAIKNFYRKSIYYNNSLTIKIKKLSY